MADIHVTHTGTSWQELSVSADSKRLYALIESAPRSGYGPLLIKVTRLGQFNSTRAFLVEGTTHGGRNIKLIGHPHGNPTDPCDFELEP